MDTLRIPFASWFTSFRSKLILIFAAATIGCVAVSTGYARYLQNTFTRMRAQDVATEELRLISSQMQAVLQWVMRDIYVLRDSPQLAEYLASSPIGLNDSGTTPTRKDFQILAAHHQLYHQIRFLDDSGMEVIRINYDGIESQFVPRHQLQNKMDRYYFTEAMKLQKGQIYISPFDLNIEEGQIETPHVPTIRYATPVIDVNGKKRGIIVLNVLGATLLNIIDRQLKQFHHHGKHYFLINSQGYYLFHPYPSKTFGFMFKNDERLQRYEPQLAASITKADHHTLVRGNDLTGKKTLFAFRRIPISSSPLDHFRFNLGDTKFKPSENTVVAPENAYWTIISAQKEADLFAGRDVYRKPFLLFTLLLFGGCILVSLFVGLSVLKPVVSLAAAARNIQGGDLSARARIYSFDEMGRFGKLFNSMAAQLEESVARLKASEKKYRTIFENSRDCFFVADGKHRIVDLNPTGSELLGIHAVQGHQPTLPFPWAEEGDIARRNFHSLLLGEGFVKNYEIKIKRGDGTIRECLMTATVKKDPKGTFIGYEGALRDITERLNRARAKHKFQKKLQEEIIMAEERERRSLGQILHEELAQNLALAHLKIQEAMADLPPEDQRLKSELEYTLKLLGQMIHQIRTMVFDLYPAMMDAQGLIPTMRWYAQSFTKRTAIPVTIYELLPCSRLTKPQEVYLFRAFKELLHNVLKHAQAMEIVVTLVEKSGYLRLSIDDDGKGFNPQVALEAQQQITGIGLFSIREWIMAMSGNLSVESGVAKGTRVLIEIPIENGHGVTND